MLTLSEFLSDFWKLLLVRMQMSERSRSFYSNSPWFELPDTNLSGLGQIAEFSEPWLLAWVHRNLAGCSLILLTRVGNIQLRAVEGPQIILSGPDKINTDGTQNSLNPLLADFKLVIVYGLQSMCQITRRTLVEKQVSHPLQHHPKWALSSLCSVFWSFP